MHDRLLVPRRQRHAALRSVAHELALLLGSAHAHAALRALETGLVVEITIRSAAPRGLQNVSLVGRQKQGSVWVTHTMLRVNSAYSLMRPWNQPKTIDSGRNIMSLGLRLKRPQSFTVFVKPKTKRI